MEAIIYRVSLLFWLYTTFCVWIHKFALDEIFTGDYYSVSALYWYLNPSFRKEVHA